MLAISVRRNGTRLDASVRVLVQRPQQHHVARPDSRVGVDVGAPAGTVASAEGTVIEQVSNPRPLDTALRELRQVSRARSRCAKGSANTVSAPRVVPAASPGQRCPYSPFACSDNTIG